MCWSSSGLSRGHSWAEESHEVRGWLGELGLLTCRNHRDERICRPLELAGGGGSTTPEGMPARGALPGLPRWVRTAAGTELPRGFWAVTVTLWAALGVTLEKLVWVVRWDCGSSFPCSRASKVTV